MSDALQNERVRANVRSLLHLAWPIVISRSTQAVIGLCDAMMVAGLGESALAATVTGAMNAYTVFVLPMGTVFIVGTFAAQHFGSGDLPGARRHGYYGLLVALATQFVGLLVIPFLPAILRLASFEASVERQMIQYLAIRFTTAGALVGMEALSSYYGALGNTRLPMLANLVAMILNLAGNWLLIGGHLGFPALGVRGAAWASALSTAVAFLGFFGVFISDRGTSPWVPKLHLSELWRMLRYGVPSGLNWFFEFLSFLFFINVIVAGLGTTPLAAFMSVFQINSVAFMPAFAVASAGAIIVGQSIGAGERDEVPKAVHLSMLMTAAWQGAIGILFLIAPRVVFSPFAAGARTEELLTLGSRVLMLSLCWQLFDASAITLAEALRAAGDTRFSMWARVVVGWVLFVPGTWLSVRAFGGHIEVAVAGIVTYLAVLALTLYLRFRGGAWRRFDLLRTETA